jgi:hypothetical protein
MKLNFEENVANSHFIVKAVVSQYGEPYHRAGEMNSWACEQFGSRDADTASWAFERTIADNGVDLAVDPPRAYTRRVFYNWIFKNKEDAMLFKLRWSNEPSRT